MGNTDLKEMDAGTMDPSGRGQTQAGKICGIIACVFLVITIVGVVLLMMLGALGAATHHN
jgi:hypothetical protein